MSDMGNYKKKQTNKQTKHTTKTKMFRKNGAMHNSTNPSKLSFNSNFWFQSSN
jgi:hypothetical protein